MGFILSIIKWLFLLGIGAVIGGIVGTLIASETGGAVGLIAGLIISQAIQATLTPGPKYPGDTNY